MFLATKMCGRYPLPIDLALVGIENVGQLERNALFRPLGPERMMTLEAVAASDEERINYYRRGSRGDEIRQLLGGRGARNSGGAVY